MMQVEVCKVIPSCFEAEINEGPVSVLANGSSFLFFIIFEKVVSVKFYDTAAVLHVSPLLCSGSQQPLALCCLSNGNISALSLKLAISRVPTEVQSADILSSLFGETCDNISAPAQAVDGRDVSVKSREMAAVAGKLSELLLSSPAPARIHDLMLEIFAVFCCICRLR
ncbi:hypothetical protein GBAR_LOCUS13457 [Geodia barretti]|uniref:Uncharacterized protein n=1 Tax=Geodia barretti TaxID=519541 RepID=A0AA35S5E5_GEOBA|nr:hypothetical protein GBAR_LOCUS13457 [Geodia barretti]